MILGAVLFGACAEESSGERLAPVVGIRLTVGDTAPVRTNAASENGPGSSERGAIEVTGLDAALLRRLSRVAPNDSGWPAALGVFVEAYVPTSDSAPAPADAPEIERVTAVSETIRGSGASRIPPVIGRYAVRGDRLRFEPRFPLERGVAYRVELAAERLAALAGLPAAASQRPTGMRSLTFRFSVPAASAERTTRVAAVHPSAHQVPENLLRWYVEFSAPMSVGEALGHVRLLDEAGREVPRAFLEVEQELWDHEHRRLTLFHDPGRVKRGVRQNIEAGAPLIAGRRYKIVVDSDWTDGAGAELASAYEREFEVVDADRGSPNPDRWRLTLPRAGTRDELRVAFGEPLDHALALRMLAVYNERGVRLSGSARLHEADSGWAFVPSTPWADDGHTLRVDSALEDLAGNSIARVFDAERPGSAAPGALEQGERRVAFRPRADR